MPRKPIRSRKKPRPILYDSMRYYFETGYYGTHGKYPDCPGLMETFLLAGSYSQKQVDAWQLNKDVIMSDWIKKNPCSRPWAWWEQDAKEIRRRVGGTGGLFNDLEDYGPHECYLGIPSAWVTVFDEAYYNGRAKDIQGKIIPSPFKEGDFPKTVYDKNDPPTFESEAKYLLRHGFLTPVEKGFLKEHLELLEPEKIEYQE